jgi:hypothetical protein
LPLFPFPARTTTRRPYVPPIIRVAARGHRGNRPARSALDRLGAGGVDRPHLRAGA